MAYDASVFKSPAYWLALGAGVVGIGAAAMQERRGSADRTYRFGTGYARNRNLTHTAAFKRWFRNSKVVDAKGRPLVVYHGTGKAFDLFDPTRLGENTNAGNTVLGFFFTDDYALARNMYAGNLGDVMEVYLSIQKPLRIRDAWDNDMGEAIRLEARDYLGHNPETNEDWLAFRDYLLFAGYDGVEFTGNAGDARYEMKVYLAFSPTQIKSATSNSGAFDPADPRINFNRRAR